MIGKEVKQLTQNLALFCSLVSLILSWNCVKSLISTNIVQKINLEGTWGELEAKRSQNIMSKIVLGYNSMKFRGFRDLF